MAVNTRVPTDITFGKRGYQTRNDFVSTQEAGQDKLSGEFSTKINAMGNEFNDTAESVTESEENASSSEANALISEEIAVASANYKGDWSSSFNSGNGYSVGMSVSYEDVSYNSKVDNNTAEPISEESSNEWYIIIKREYNYLTKTSNYTAVKKDYINIDSNGGSFAITLPAIHTVDEVIIINTSSTCEDNSVTIDGNGSNILFQNEVDTTLVLDKNGIELKFKSNGTDWRVL